MWIHELKTLKPLGFNAELNFPNPKISAFLVQISLRRPCVKENVISLQRHSRRKTNIKFENNNIC